MLDAFSRIEFCFIDYQAMNFTLVDLLFGLFSDKQQVRSNINILLHYCAAVYSDRRARS